MLSPSTLLFVKVSHLTLSKLSYQVIDVCGMGDVTWWLNKLCV